MPRPRSSARSSPSFTAQMGRAASAAPTPPDQRRSHPLAAAVKALLIAGSILVLGVVALYAIGQEPAVAASVFLFGVVGAGVRITLGLVLVFFAGVEFLRQRGTAVAADRVYVAPAFAGALGLGLVGGTGGGLAAIALAIPASALIWQRSAASPAVASKDEASDRGPAEHEIGDSLGVERPAAGDDVPH
ncbi:hypothetical protein Pla163_09590 [Planctomycetes bacterium Pla163]|uniref:Uncharacterized protein n=1 Tax=Rohdeia mirabilis TaxID=2528008 RepID=A0A518CXB7_9BACT|nr:hypothetical protein Pla163_09590 [Planctomycetes bacterium Pla163]